LKFRLLVRGQIIFDPNRHAHVQRFDLTLGVEHFAELRQSLLLIDLRGFHRFMQSFHSVLQLPLKFIEARRGALNLAAHELLLLIRQGQLALMLHDQLGRKHRVAQRVIIVARRARLSLPFRILRRLRLLRRRERGVRRNQRRDDASDKNDSFHRLLLLLVVTIGQE
jgi:hypothetical protein